MNDESINDLAYWFPKVEAAGLHVPETRIVQTDLDLYALLDGAALPGWEAFLSDVGVAARSIGYPCFLRTGYLSGKHSWGRTCYVPEANELGAHISALIEESALADFAGFPVDIWVVRRLIETYPLFRCLDWQGFPVVREFRIFVRAEDIEACYPYWPAESLVSAAPDRANWRELLRAASYLSGAESRLLTAFAREAVRAVDGGYWSIDFVQDRHGSWWLTDMADGDRSWRPE